MSDRGCRTGAVSARVYCGHCEPASRSTPRAGTARRQWAPCRGAAPGGSGARVEEGAGASTARARGTSSDLLLSRAVQRPAAQSCFELNRSRGTGRAGPGGSFVGVDPSF